MDGIGVLFLTNWLPVGGFETHLLSIIKELSRTSVRPVVACLKAGGPLEPDFRKTGVPVYTRLQKHRLDPMGLPNLVRVMRRERIQLLDTDVMRNTVLLGTLAAGLAGVKATVVSVHLVVRVERPGIVEWPARISMGLVDRVVALFEDHRTQLIEQEKVDPRKIVILPNGVDTDEFRPRPPETRLRRELGIPDDSAVVAIVASLHPFKGHQVFLKAAARVLESCPNVHFLVVGEGPEKAALEALARELGVAGSVHFLGRRRDVPDLLTIVDVSVLSSYWEAAPISALEALACGIPMVATGVGALKEMVEDGKTGFLLNVGDHEGLARSIRRLVDDRDLRARMGAFARQRTEGLFSIRKTVRNRETFYRELLEEKSGRKSSP